MLLEDATSKIQVQRALDDGDEELREDIEEKLDEAMRWWDSRGIHDNVHQDEVEVDFKEIATWEAFIDEVISESPSAYDLSIMDRDEVATELRWVATRPSQRQRQTHYGPFYVDTSTDHFSFKLSTALSAYFPEDQLPDNAEYIPVEQARDFWDRLDGHFVWEQRDRVEENNGSAEGEPMFVVADQESFDEWCRDLIAQNVQLLVKKDPEKAKEIFIKAVEYENRGLGAKLRAAALPGEEILDFASKWFEGEEEREEILTTLKEYFAALEGGGPDEPREILGDWTQDELRAMGITKGTLYEEAPWTLIKLHPADLRLEGTLMRHCVGDKGMGYFRALRDGEIEVWSLRSRANKPRFTLEVDGSFNEHVADGDKKWAASCIKQLKGKANRTPGYADARATEIKFPDEVIFWDHVLREFDVDPSHVDDFRAASEAQQTLDDYRQHGAFGHPPRRQIEPNAATCVGFDLPYRPL